MPNPGRRDFLKNSMVTALAPAAAGALRLPGLFGDPEPAQTPREDFFKGFKTEQIKTSGATINTISGGNRNGPPLLLLHGIPGNACAVAQGRAGAGARIISW